MAYDSESLRLAEHFLQDEPRTTGDAADLAQVIQTAVEDWFASRMPKCAQCDGSGVIARSIHFPCGYVGPGPVPDCARNVSDAKCDCCGGSGWTEKEVAF